MRIVGVHRPGVRFSIPQGQDTYRCELGHEECSIYHGGPCSDDALLCDCTHVMAVRRDGAHLRCRGCGRRIS